jgi:hypothetical protein
VPKDSESFLAYSRQESFAFVLYFNVPLSENGRQSAQIWTRELVDAAIGSGGTYYLPYQLYPSQEQIRSAYPALDRFFAKKRDYDRHEIFGNCFYDHYRPAN